MSKAEELLDGLTDEQIALYSTTPETEPHIIVDSERRITIPEELKRLAVQYDHNMETVIFDCPRYWDDIDMSTMYIYINYMRSDGKLGMDLADNVTVDATDDTIMHFSWTVKAHATEAAGPLTFLVCIKKTNNYGEEINHWNSELCTTAYISEGLEGLEEVINANADIITDLLTRMDNVENFVTPDYVRTLLSNVFEEHPELLTEHIEKVVTPESIEQTINEYLEENMTSIENNIASKLDVTITPESLNESINTYFEENPTVITSKVEATVTPEFIQNNIEEYFEENPIEIPDAVETDKTLTKIDVPADAAAVGEQLATLRDNLDYNRKNLLVNTAGDIVTEANLTMKKAKDGSFTVTGVYDITNDPSNPATMSDYMMEFYEQSKSEEYDKYILWYGMRQYYTKSSPRETLTNYFFGYLKNTGSTIGETAYAGSDYLYRERQPGYQYAILIQEGTHYNPSSSVEQQYTTMYMPCVYDYDGTQMRRCGDYLSTTASCTITTAAVYNCITFDGYESPFASVTDDGIDIKLHPDDTLRNRDAALDGIPWTFIYGSNVPCFGTEEDILEYFTTGNVSKALYCPERIAGSGGDTEEVSSYMAEFAEMSRSEEFDKYVTWYGETWWNKKPSGSSWITKRLYYFTQLGVGNNSSSATTNYGTLRKDGCKYAILIQIGRHYAGKSATWSDIYIPSVYCYENGQMTNKGSGVGYTAEVKMSTAHVWDIWSCVTFSGTYSYPFANSNYFDKSHSYLITEETDTLEVDAYHIATFVPVFTYGSNVPCFATTDDILDYFTTGNVSNALFVPPGLETDGVTYMINDSQELSPGQYILSGAPSLNYPGAYLAVTAGDKTYMDIGGGVTFDVTDTEPVLVSAVLGNKYKYKNTLFQPMIRIATDEDDTYKPYIDSIENRLNDLEEVTDNPILLMTGTVTVGDIAAGATVTVNVTPVFIPGYRPLILMYVNNSASMRDVIPSAMSSTFVNDSTSFTLTNVGETAYSNVTVGYSVLLRRI